MLRVSSRPSWLKKALALSGIIILTGSVPVWSAETAPEAEAEVVEPSVEDPSPEAAEQAEDKRRSLEELLAVPFQQLKEMQQAEYREIEAPPGEDNATAARPADGDIRLPPPPEQGKHESDLEQQLDVFVRELLPNDYVGVTVSVKYTLQTIPISRSNKQISKVKLPGFENSVWVPSEKQRVVGIINQIQTYTTVFAVVNQPISLFNVEVLRQVLSDRVEGLNLRVQDVLKVVYVPTSKPSEARVERLSNAAAEHEEAKQTAEAAAEEAAVAEEETTEGETADAKAGAAAETEPEEEKPEIQPEDVDMQARMETTRHLLQAREAYFQNDFDSAIDDIRKALEINPYSSQGYEMLGSIYYRLNWTSMAVENWQRALELDPENKNLRKYLNKLTRR